MGGSSGIVLATAERAAGDGATVIVSSSSAERIDAALAQLPASAEGYAVDVRREEQILDLFGRLGRSLVLSSGIAGTRPEPTWTSRRLSAARWTRSRAPWRSS